MKLETIYNDLIDIINDNMNLNKAPKLKEKLEKAIREETCYKTTPKTRVNAIKRVASKMENRPALTGFESFINFDKSNYDISNLDYNDVEQFYKLHKKNADKELYEIKGQLYNIKFIKNIIDVLGTDTTLYTPKNEYRPLYVVNKENEIGLVLPVRKF